MMECALLFTHDKLFAWACSHHSAILSCVDLICLYRSVWNTVDGLQRSVVMPV